MTGNIILVDFFDTVMYREIHSSQLIPQWEKVLANKYNIPDEVSINKIRRKIIADLGVDCCAQDYKTLIHNIYLELNQNGYCYCEEKDFYETAYMTEVYIDLATQYPNWKMINFLKKQKKKGKRIFLVTDYYLPVSAYKIFLEQYKLTELFEKIYCSSEYAKTKWEGNLYEEVLQDLKIEACQIHMIGDSKQADVISSKKLGIKGHWYFPLFHKIKTNFYRYAKIDFGKVCAKKLYRRTYQYSLFGEYGINLYYFSKNLYSSLLKEGFDKVNFLSRGGYLLKRIFDDYQKICVNERNIIESVYLMNSRKVNKLAEEDEEQRSLLVDYFRPHIDSRNRLCLVDEGWNCSSQIALTGFLDCDTYGFYIGLLKNKHLFRECVRKGILFHMDEKDKKDDFYGVFRTNCTFYEQMCQAPEGAVEQYAREDGRVVAILKRDETEKILHDKYTKDLQHQIETTALSLMVWNAEVNKKMMAVFMLKTLLFANKDRLCMLRAYQDLRYDNFEGRKQNWIGDGKPVKISLWKLLMKPEEYMRYFCKIKEVMSDSIVKRWVYYPIGFLIWLWCGFSIIRKPDGDIPM